MAFDGAHVAVQQGDLPKSLHESLARLRRQTDLGHQHDRLATIGDDFVDRLHVDFGLAATGDAMQQDRLLFLEIEGLQDLTQCLPLIGTQSQWRAGWSGRSAPTESQHAFVSRLR